MCPLRSDEGHSARPDAVLLILDSTNLSRHLVLAAPVLSLGLPTLVILNMADDLKSRGGELNVAELAIAARLARCAGQRSQRRIGLEKIFQFLSGATLGAAPKAPLIQLLRHSGHPEMPCVGHERR